MADYFTHFSCLLDVGTPANAARALDLYNTLSADGASEEPPSEGFLLSIRPEHGASQLWMRNEATGNPERLIQFVERCAAEFGLTGRWGFHYANTCSRPRLDGFRRRRARPRSRDRRGRGLDLHRWLARLDPLRRGRSAMSIPAHARSNFQTLLRAAGDGNLALMECLDAVTGSPRYVICAVGRDEDDHVFTPFGHLADGNPYDTSRPPDPDDPEGFVRPEAGEAP